MRLRISSLLLLVLLLRVLLPESAILALHRHTHTMEKSLGAHQGEEQVDTQHIHCGTDQLFQKSFYTLNDPVNWPVASANPPSYRDRADSVWKFTFPHNNFLRGPPAHTISLA